MNERDDERKGLADNLFDYTIIGASRLAHGITDFSEWSKAMLNEGDHSIRRFLPLLFQNSKEMLKGLQKLEQPPADPEEPPELRAIREELAAAEIEMNTFLEGLLQSGSAVQAEFATRFKRYRIENPEYFDDPKWVEKLQAECMRDQST